MHSCSDQGHLTSSPSQAPLRTPKRSDTVVRGCRPRTESQQHHLKCDRELTELSYRAVRDNDEDYGREWQASHKGDLLQGPSGDNGGVWGLDGRRFQRTRRWGRESLFVRH